MTITSNFKEIRESIQQAATQCGRSQDSIQLLAVSKKKGSKLIKEAYDCGQFCFGENYIQEAASKIPELPKKITWHFIGHLQSNKAKLAAELFDVIQTVDSLKLAKALDKHASVLDKKLSILIQVNIGVEEQKSGIAPDEAEKLIRNIRESTKLNIAGLMIIPPFTASPEMSRQYFKETKKLADGLAQKSLFSDNERVELSMGMTGDFQIAIEEGATIVRIGTALFGTRE